MKKLLVFTFAVLSCVQTRAQEVVMRDVFIAMPGSFTPYLSHNDKLDLIDFMESGMASEITNGLDGKTRLDTLTADYLRLQLSPASQIEMKLLPYTSAVPSGSAGRVVCLVTTFGNAPAESSVRFYTTDWKPVAIEVPTGELSDGLTARPDTMGLEQFAALSRILSPRMLVCRLSPDAPVLTVQLSAPMLTTEDKKKIAPLLRAKNLKWDGENFK